MKNKNNLFDNQLKKGLQEQAKLFQMSDDTNRGFEKVMNRLQQEKRRKKEELLSMKRFNMKKAVIATAAAVMALGTLTLASSGIKYISSGSSVIPDYTKYTDLATAEDTVGVVTDAPENFSNGYRFLSINIDENSYHNEEHNVIDTFSSVSVRYKKGSDSIYYDVQPRAMEADYAKNPTDTFEADGITYYYTEMRNKWVTPGYQPTEEEKAQMEAGKLNIGYGASEISYSDSKGIAWEKDGHKHELFCMDVDISKEEFIEMALEIK